MNYELVKSSNKDIDRLVEYKKKTVYEYAKDLAREDIDRINNYIIKEIPDLINDYYKEGKITKETALNYATNEEMLKKKL